MEAMKPTTHPLYVDVGQTGSRVVDTTATKITSTVGYFPGAPLDSLVEDILKTIENRAADTVVLSLTGLRGQVPDITSLVAACRSLTSCTAVGVADDGLAWNVGSLDGDDGVSLAAGGGVVAVSRQGHSFHHLDGNGSDFGDSGGAYWLGKKGIRSAIRALEGSDEPTTLTHAFGDHFGPHDDFVRNTVGTEAVHRATISFAKAVLDAGVSGDQVASRIVSKGATRLARLVAQGAHLAGLPDTTTVALGGGLMKHPHYRQLVIDHITASGGCYNVIDPLGDALDGLHLLDKTVKDDIVNLLTWWRA